MKADKNTSPAAKDLLLAHDFSEILKKLYPEALCSLEADGDPWKLLIMARLSAQCSDEMVNRVCRPLFSHFPTPSDMAEAPVEKIEEIIRPCGLYRGKADSISRISKIIVNDYGGKIPDTMEELLALPGVGRKIANLVLGDIFSMGGIVADTHCIRICGRMGFYPEGDKNPLKTEKIMEKLIPREEQSDFCHRIVHFGREFCRAKDPACNICPAGNICRKNTETPIERQLNK